MCSLRVFTAGWMGIPTAQSTCTTACLVLCCLTVPRVRLIAQAFDSTAMPSLEMLATEAGRASRAHPIRAVAHTLLCEPAHPLVDSASVAACAALPADRATAIAAAFARGIQVPLAGPSDGDSTVALPICPTDLERAGAPRVLIGRVSAPVVGVYEGRWEGRLTVELRCRAPNEAGNRGVRIFGKSYLYQWTGSTWKMYQHSWTRAGH